MRNLDLPIEEIITCYHCGNETLMSQAGEYEWGSSATDYEVFDFNYKYEMFACPVCHKITLREIYGDETMTEPNHLGQTEWYNTKNIIFPTNRIDSNAIPSKVKEAFESALKVKGIDKSICLMALRRTLELILIEKGATKWSLKDKIEEVADKGLLPDTLREASSIAKMFGDSATHGRDLEINQHDVDSMTEFIQYIIEFLYVLPDKISSYKERLSDKNEGNA